MVRMWMQIPKILCRVHLCGEHVELHMLVGSLNKHRSVSGYIEKNRIEPHSIIDRHKIVAQEMLERGYNHNSPLPSFDISYLPLEEQEYRIDKASSLKDLLTRCEKCSERYHSNF